MQRSSLQRLLMQGSIPWYAGIPLLAIALLADPPVCAATTDAPASPIRLHSRTIHPDPGLDAGAGLDVLARAHGARPLHLLVQLDTTPDAALQAELAARGIELQGYLPERAYVARVRPGLQLADLAGLPVRYLGPLLPDDKIARTLQADRPPDHIRVAGERIALYVEMHRDVPLEAGLHELMRDLGARVISRLQALGGAIILVDAADWRLVAERDVVKWVEPASPQFEELSDGVREAMGVETVQVMPEGLSGDGVGVLVYDGGIACPYHQDFLGRVTAGESGPTSNHATHVTGILAGSGAESAGLYRGMAPGADIVSYYYESCYPICLYNNPQDIEDNYRDGLESHDIDIASNSIGSNIAANGYDCEYEGDYENTARLIDAIARGALGTPLLSVWAAGNERQGAARCGADYGTIGIPATAKNSIVVGATYSDADTIAGFSGFGPVDDGRMRPDVVAPGCELDPTGGGVAATRNCQSYTVMCGTSMATPAVAGVAALMLERLRSNGSLLTHPLPSTYKAIFAASAVDLGRAGPDYMYGYGRVSATDAIALIDGGAVTESSLAHGERVALTVSVPAGLATLRIGVAWDDAPGEPLSTVNLVNDLELRVIAPDLTAHYPYVLNPFVPDAPAARGANHCDPSELIEVDDPTPGIWTVEVHGLHVPDGPQSFSVAVNAPAEDGAAAVDDRPLADPGPTVMRLAQNTPNPFNPSTTIGFALNDGSGPVGLRIYDSTGRMIRVLVDRSLGAGEHAVTWDGCDQQGRTVASGIYFYALEHRGERRVRRMTLTR